MSEERISEISSEDLSKKTCSKRVLTSLGGFLLFFTTCADNTETKDKTEFTEITDDNDNAGVITAGDFADSDDEALYSAIFGSVAKEKDILLDYEVLIDGEKVGTAPVFTGSNRRIQAAALKNMLAEFLEPSDIALIDGKTDKEGFVTFKDLTKLSFKTRLNRISMCVEVSLPIEKKKVRSLSSFSKRRETPNAFPANISGMCNVRVSQSFYKDTTSYNTKHLVLTPALNFWGLCLEGATSYAKSSNSTEKGKFVRDYTTAVYDIPKYDTTLRYGDVFSHSLSYQSVPHVWGININKGVEQIRQSGEARTIQLTILRTSTIEVYSNGHLIRTRNKVAPGTYTLDDISFHNGANDIKIKIIDDTGHEEILDESCFYESSYVPKGAFTFNGTYGYPQIQDKTEGRYDKKHPIYSGTVRYGLLPSVELGLGMLRNNIGHTLSYEVKNKNILGSFDFKFANSSYKQDLKNIQGKVFYASYNSPSFKLGAISTGGSVSYESSDNFFKPYLSERTSSSSSADSFLKSEENLRGKNKSISYGLYLSNVFSVNFNFNGSRRKRYDGARSQSNSFSVSKGLDFHNDWFSSGSISTSFDRSRDYDGKRSKSFSLYFSLFFANRISMSSGVSKTDDSRTEYLTMSYFPERSGLGGEISANRSSDVRTISGHMSYSHHLFSGNVSHSRTNKGSSSTNIGMETGIFFADTRYGFARPIYSDGGFVIVTPKKALADKKLKFVSQNMESGFLGGGAVIPNSKTSVSMARLDVSDMPIGVDIKKDTIISYGEYKRGFIADVEAEGSYTADGYLYDSDGEAFQRVTGYAIHTTDLTARPITFFTSDTGRFVLTELKQGKYKISVNVDGVQDFEIEIGASNEAIIHLGKFTCKDTDDQPEPSVDNGSRDSGN